MLIDHFYKSDSNSFLEFAALENWISDPWELDYLLDIFPAGCFCARDEDGEVIGFVTATTHNKSGWIGNLLVESGSRGQGIGKALFLKAMLALREVGTGTIWLTASEAGKPLYEKYGFRVIDTINRWVGEGTGNQSTISGNGNMAVNSALDKLGWGDERYPLLHTVSSRGFVQAEADGFAVLHPCGEILQLGPWAAMDAAAASRVLDAAMQMIPAGVRVVCDVPAGNGFVADKLQSHGFKVHGSNELMYCGIMPDYRPMYIYSLATMGSCG
jgi:ribosomal protein S18 acetylase RimI-like enzyme